MGSSAGYLWADEKYQRLKVGDDATPVLHVMNIWLKHYLSTRSQRLLCFKASRHNVRGGWGGQTGQYCFLTAALSNSSSSLLQSLFCSPVLSIYHLCFLYCLFLWVLVQENTFFIASLIATSAFVFHFFGLT